MSRQRECEECGAPAVWRILQDGGDRQAENGFAEATAVDCYYCDECWQEEQETACWYGEERLA